MILSITVNNTDKADEACPSYLKLFLLSIRDLLTLYAFLLSHIRYDLRMNSLGGCLGKDSDGKPC